MKKMIINFKVSNFESIKEEQEISFKISKKDHLDDSSLKINDDLYLNNVACLMGQNGSGKTNILKALMFALSLIESSYENQSNFRQIPIMPHKLAERKNSFFEIEFINKNIFYLYKIEFNKEMVVNEFLGVHKKRNYSFLYKSQRDKKGKINIRFADEKIKLTDEDHIRLETRRNITAFSFLKNLGYLSLFGLSEIIENYKYNITKIEEAFYDIKNAINISEKLSKNPKLMEKILELIKNSDFDVSEITIQKIVLGLQIDKNKPSYRNMLFLKHKNDKCSFELPIFKESHGTQNIISLSIDLFDVLENGGLFIIDEIEKGIHPYVVKKLISFFSNKEINKKNAQLIFSTHQPWFLQDRTKTQIFLLEKNENLATEIWRLDNMEKIRNDENYFLKYLTGAYGAVPEMKWL